MSSFYQQNHSNDFLYDAYASEARRRFSRISLSLVICTFVTYASVLLLQLILSGFAFYEALSANIYWQWCISLLPLYLFGMPAAYLVLRTVSPTPPKDAPMEIGELLLLFLVGRFVTLVGSYVSNFLVSFAEGILRRPITDTTTELVTDTPGWLIFIAAVIIAPIAEEFIYRKLIIDRLYVHGAGVAILFSSLVFSLAHGNFFQVFYAFLNGYILGLIYTKTGRLRYSIAFHMATNFLGSIAVLPIMEAQERLEGLLAAGETTAEYVFLSLSVTGYSVARFAVALLGAFVLFKAYKSYTPSRSALQPLPTGSKLRIATLNGGFIAFIFMSALEFTLSLF